MDVYPLGSFHFGLNWSLVSQVLVCFDVFCGDCVVFIRYGVFSGYTVILKSREQVPELQSKLEENQKKGRNQPAWTMSKRGRAKITRAARAGARRNQRREASEGARGTALWSARARESSAETFWKPIQNENCWVFDS